jgi:hypothetical protein
MTAMTNAISCAMTTRKRSNPKSSPRAWDAKSHAMATHHEARPTSDIRASSLP